MMPLVGIANDKSWMGFTFVGAKLVKTRDARKKKNIKKKKKKKRERRGALFEVFLVHHCEISKKRFTCRVIMAVLGERLEKSFIMLISNKFD